MTASHLPFSKGARVALIGMGLSNRGVLQMLGARPDLRISLRDKKPFALTESLPFTDPTRILVGESYLSDLSEDVLFLAPTVRTDLPEILEARARGTLVTTDTAFFFENARSTLFAVTGSDGKSTTSSLGAEILRFHSHSVHLGGNIGIPLSPVLMTEAGGDFAVAELSSFQLMHRHKAPKRAIVTNLTPNHLDFHSSLEEYYNVKINLLLSANEPIVNLDDAKILTRVTNVKPFVGYTTKESAQRCLGMEHLYTVRDDVIYLDGSPYLSLSQVKRQGFTFCKNLLAALALTHGHHEKDVLADSVARLQPLPHRRELVRTIRGVRFYNSSVDSSPSRTRETLSDFPFGVILILGGRSKGVPYTILTDVLNERARAVVLTGENASLIREQLVGLRVPLHECESFEDAVSLSASLAREGDTVLFSPASTSFDRFHNFEERGERFSELVRSL